MELMENSHSLICVRDVEILTCIQSEKSFEDAKSTL